MNEEELPQQEEPAPRAMPPWIALVLSALLLVGYVMFQVVPLLGDRGTGITGLASHANDYKHIYIGSELIAHGFSPYDAVTVIGSASYMREMDPRFGDPTRDEVRILPYVYLPYTGIVLRPITRIPFAESVVAFQILNHLMILGGVVLLAISMGGKWQWNIALLLAAVAFNAAVFRQNNAGQLNAVLFFGIALLWVALVKNWHAALIGAIAAFLMVFKISPGLFLIWFLFRREWSRAAWMVIFAIVYTGSSMGTANWKIHFEFLGVLRDMGYGRSTWAEYGNTFWRDPYNQSFNALFHRLLVPYPGSGITPWFTQPAYTANILTITMAVMIFAAFAQLTERKRGPIVSRTSFAAAVCASLLIPSIMWDHYLLQAIVPAALLWSIAGTKSRVVIAGAVALSAWAIPLDAEPFRQGLGLLVMSIKLLPPLVLFVMCFRLAENEVVDWQDKSDSVFEMKSFL